MTLLSTRALNRTLWVRQQLVPAHRSVSGTTAMVGHLVGLQAQDNLPPYLALAARLADFDPHDLSERLERREVVRFLTLRGTVHVLTPEDALSLRGWVQPTLDRLGATSAQSRAARHLDTTTLEEVLRAELAGGARSLSDLGAVLATRFPEVPEATLRHVVRERLPLLQAPPRGQWKRSGGVVYAFADEWLRRPFAAIDLPALVLRYLRAFGPATPADMTTWSAVTRLAPTFKAMHAAGELVTHNDEQGRTLYDVPDGMLGAEGLELPPLMLGTYDNVFLSHADRSRIAPDTARRRWMGVNGAVAATLFVDGLLCGTWQFDGDRFEVDAVRALTAGEKAGVESEKERVRALLDR